MNQKRKHRWNVNPTEAVAIQKRLRDSIALHPLPKKFRHVCGLDASYLKGENLVFGGAVVVDLEDGKIVEQRWMIEKSSFPYVPGLLTFREGPVLCRVLEGLKQDPDVLLFDGQGIAHPRRMGIATHMGILFDLPSVGCAKTRLCGEYVEPGRQRGRSRLLRHHGEEIGRVLRTRQGVKPVFVSPGHRSDIDSSVALVLHAATRFRLPDPIRYAHRLVNDLRGRQGSVGGDRGFS